MSSLLSELIINLLNKIFVDFKEDLKFNHDINSILSEIECFEHQIEKENVIFSSSYFQNYIINYNIANRLIDYWISMYKEKKKSSKNFCREISKECIDYLKQNINISPYDESRIIDYFQKNCEIVCNGMNSIIKDLKIENIQLNFLFNNLIEYQEECNKALTKDLKNIENEILNKLNSMKQKENDDLMNKVEINSNIRVAKQQHSNVNVGDMSKNAINSSTVCIDSSEITIEDNSDSIINIGIVNN